MTDGPGAQSGEIDLTRPSAARVCDYYLGGAHNFAVDRERAKQAIALWPDLPLIMRSNRPFLRRAVLFSVAQGIRQFPDLAQVFLPRATPHFVPDDVDERPERFSGLAAVDRKPMSLSWSLVM